jgi:hypothetical protein
MSLFSLKIFKLVVIYIKLTASGSSFHILIDLSASAEIKRVPDLSNVNAKMPLSESIEPG